MTKKFVVTASFLMVLFLLFSPFTAAEPWEIMKGETIRIVVGFGAGGSHDISARTLANQLQDYGIDARVINMPGSVGAEAAYHVANQDPDSNMFFWGHGNIMLFTPVTHDLGYTFDDFEPIATIGSPTFVLGSRAGAPWDNLGELKEYIEENPGMVIFGGQGTRHIMHYKIEQILPPDELDYVYVALEGGAEVAMSLTGGHVDVGHLSMTAALPLHEDGDLTTLAHTQIHATTVELMPEVPHVSEFDIDASEPQSLALWSPKGTSLEVREALSSAVGEILNDPDVRETFTELGFEVHYLDVEETYEFFRELEEEIVPSFVEWFEAF